jgi:hypothetical protein
MQDFIKTAAKFVREQLTAEGIEVGSSHAHAAISAYCGFNSKKALIDHGPNIEDENLILSITPNLQKLAERVSEMKQVPLQSVPTDHLADLITTALTPACEFCGVKQKENQPIGDSYDPYFEPDGWVCSDCASSEEDEYAICRFCGPNVIYRADQINYRGECPEHDGESVMDEEEEQDWEDYIENVTKDL